MVDAALMRRTIRRGPWHSLYESLRKDGDVLNSSASHIAVGSRKEDSKISLQLRQCCNINSGRARNGLFSIISKRLPDERTEMDGYGWTDVWRTY